MRKIGACVAIVALTAVVSWPGPARAFSIRIGPYHFVFSPSGHRHHRRSRSAAPSYRPAPPASAQEISSALLYPPLALPAIYARVFSSGGETQWPFDYRSIFLAGFGKQPANARLCRRQTDLAAEIVARIRNALEPDGVQLRRLQGLENALNAAADSLAKVCPSEIPAQPIARLELVESQIARTTAALDMVRQPLLDFQQSLDDEQRARFAVMIGTTTSRTNSHAGNTGCGATADETDWPIDEISRSVQPTDAQRDALGDLKQALAAAAKDLAAHCLASLPPTAPSRLEDVDANLVAMRHTVASIRAALTNFQLKLSDEQKARFNAIDLTPR
jgi:LTXXQ motif family protein